MCAEAQGMQSVGTHTDFKQEIEKIGTSTPNFELQVLACAYECVY